MPPKRKIEANDSSSPTLTPPPKRRSIVDAMDRTPSTPDAELFKIQCVEDGKALLSRDTVPVNTVVPVNRAQLYGKVLWTERRSQEFMLVYFAPVDEPASIDDILSLTRDAPYEKKIKNMSSIYCSAVYGAPDDPKILSRLGALGIASESQATTRSIRA
ncbi:unnamed protein product, partial [Aphanomyces euteiches]